MDSVFVGFEAYKNWGGGSSLRKEYKIKFIKWGTNVNI